MSVVVSHDLESNEQEAFLKTSTVPKAPVVNLSMLRDKVRCRFYTYVPWHSIVFWVLLVCGLVYVYVSMYRVEDFRMRIVQTEEKMIAAQYTLRRIMCRHVHDASGRVPEGCAHVT